MHFKSTAMAKAMSLCATFALAFALSACDDSGTAANGESGGSSGGASPESTVQAMQNGTWTASKSCDFKESDKVWKYSYWGKDDEKVTITYEYLSNKIRVTEVTDDPLWDAEDCNRHAQDHEEGTWDTILMKTVSATCAGNILVHVQEMTTDTQAINAYLSELGDQGAVTYEIDLSRHGVFEGIMQECRIELDLE